MPPQASAQSRPRRSGHGGKDTPVEGQFRSPQVGRQPCRAPAERRQIPPARATRQLQLVKPPSREPDHPGRSVYPGGRPTSGRSGWPPEGARRWRAKRAARSSLTIAPGCQRQVASVASGAIRAFSRIRADSNSSNVEGVAEGLPVQPGGKGAHAIRMIAEPVRRNLGHGVRRQRRQRETA